MRQSAEVGTGLALGDQGPTQPISYHLLTDTWIISNDVYVLWCHAKGHFKCLEALVAWGVDADYEIPHMGTPLYSACRCREFLCARKLLDGGKHVPKFTQLC